MQSRLAEIRPLVEAELNAAIDALPAGDLSDAMRYAVQGGKRLRAFLVMESARLHGLDDDASLPVAAAVEALHAYSLVHDDLPAMDDDDLRRGQPTVHVKWTEATAILAGDALQTLAFQLLADPRVGDDAARMRLVGSLAQASGAAGMVWGQALDIAAETSGVPLDLDAIIRLQGGKTGALIRFAATAGPLMAGADPAALDDYAQAVGLPSRSRTTSWTSRAARPRPASASARMRMPTRRPSSRCWASRGRGPRRVAWPMRGRPRWRVTAMRRGTFGTWRAS